MKDPAFLFAMAIRHPLERFWLAVPSNGSVAVNNHFVRRLCGLNEVVSITPAHVDLAKWRLSFFSIILTYDDGWQESLSQLRYILGWSVGINEPHVAVGQNSYNASLKPAIASFVAENAYDLDVYAHARSLSIKISAQYKARKFAIMGFARSGTTFLCDLLDSLPQVVCAEEPFHPDAPLNDVLSMYSVATSLDMAFLSLL